MTRGGRSRLTIGLGVAVAVATVVSPPGATAAEPAARHVPGHTVTLITGDRVTVTGDRARVRPGPDRGHVRFVQRLDEEGDVHVLPTDVAADLAAGRLDGRLFDVGGLIRAGYHDAATAVTPLIITYDGPAARLAGARDVRALPSVNGVSLTAAKSSPFLSAARTAGVGTVWLDGPVRANLDRSVAQVGAPTAWAAGHTGAGTTVAVLDTGVDERHPDLAGAVVDSRNFSDSATTDDLMGHGTHVASTITGDGGYQGVAPDSVLLNGKVLGDGGGGYESDIIAGMEWAAAAGADVVNMSLGSSSPTDGTDPMSLAVNRLTAETGALFVIAAGNSGPSSPSIGSPGSADAALTVGAVDRGDALASFSSRGPRISDAAIKPDITAPGVGIVAARAANGRIGDPVGDGHVSLSGTSMAAPHVAGAAAILAGQHPDWPAERIKAALMGSAEPHPDLTPYEQGAGRLDVARASRQGVSATPGSLSLGLAPWPHHDDAPIVRKLAYTNSATTPVTLRVSAELRHETGAAAPAGMLTVSPAEVTIEAGGQAEVTVTATTSLGSLDGAFGGAVSATDGTSTVRTPVGVHKEVESYDVELTFLNLDGERTSEYFYRFVDIAKPTAYVNHDPDGTLTTRIPKGEYFFDAFVQSPADGRWPLTFFEEPAFAVTADTSMVVDAREGNPIAVTIDRPEAAMGRAELFFDRRTDWGTTGNGLIGNTFEDIAFAPSRTTAPGEATLSISSLLARPDARGTFIGSPYQYNVGWSHDGGVPDDLERHFADRDLVTVRTTAAGQDAAGYIASMAGGPLPLTVTEYFSRGVAWHNSFDQANAQNPGALDGFQAVARPVEFDRPTAQKWNAAVYGPAFPAHYWVDEWAGRHGDAFQASIPMFTDQDPNHWGHSTTDTARTTLHRGDVLIASSEYAGALDGTDPGGSGTYRLHAEATRSVSPLSTKVVADWTFRSAPGAGDEPAALPLLAVRFAPSLDDRNRAPSGQAFTVPVYVQRNGSTTEGVRKPAVQVSYDDGRTWRPAPVLGGGDRWQAVLLHPATAEFVSLRAQARDAGGGTVDQTIIRAYALK
ncbi:S8 family serine peptidase [Actinokineospora sp. 24-640]